ncbi:CocE/NonD family hydrolase [Spirillospora albida]|uniref:CocE/NonD family hydrolase n=1 Tax=Spirillospora albida TaxID=58123 RepID=UPI001B8098B3|nr:CocE/NonD family hydrolase [Spirillospora albida]
MSPRIEPDVTVRAGDCAPLVGDLFLPAAAPAPCVVIRTPYGTPGLWPEAAALAQAGLAVLVQDVRGRHRSGGVFRPGADEGPDGAATLDWVASRPWSDGRVLLSGTAYEAFAAWCAAGHPAVRAVASRQPWPPDGTPATDEELWWRTDLGTGGAARPGLYDLITGLDPDAGADPAAPGFADRWPVPLGPWPPRPREEAGRLATRGVRAANVPTLHVGSWYCASAHAVLRHARLAADGTAVMGGWASPLTHRLRPDCALDVLDGPDPADLVLGWLAAQARGDRWSVAERCLVIGDGWTGRDPLPPEPPAHRSVPFPEPRAVLRHDPARPVRSLPHSAALGPPEDRPDLLRLTVPGPLAWHGAAVVTAGAATTAPVDLVATFVHARPDGVRTRITDAVAPVPAGGGRAELRAAPVAVRLPAGHALHVELTAGRPPRRPAPPVPADVALDLGPLLLPPPEDRP